MHTKNASLQLDQSLQAVAQALFADGDAVGVPRLPTAIPAAPEAPPQRESYWGGVHTFSRVLFSGAPTMAEEK